MGAPFVVLGANSSIPAQVRAAIGAGNRNLGEFGHLAKGLADLIDSGLTFKFPNSGTAKWRLPTQGKETRP
jgi:hypothetical protein